ncbi:hypothetical protein Gogos_015250 [Gossypium gossypioides]|uniref:DUF4283 domain-containing protein n=1 Tax=Gossypium gossypioides TaxID=34282 RepID=A0A7J9C167_GOSGO|nr:hypothetical protein [Gossypium gossypioides]
METELAGLTLNEEEEAVLQIQLEPNTEREARDFRLVGCFLTASIIHFPTMKSTMANLWHPVRGVQIRDLGEKRFLFQFFHVMDMDRVLKESPWTFNNHLLFHDVPTGFFSENLAMQLGNFIGKFMDYDRSNLGKENQNFMRIRVQIDIRRPLKRKKQEGKGKLGGNREDSRVLGNSLFDVGKKSGCVKAIDLVLGFNLEGRSSFSGQWGENSLADQVQTAMDHDLEYGVLIGDEGKKRAKGRLKN